jgi:hypothetical protein
LEEEVGDSSGLADTLVFDDLPSATETTADASAASRGELDFLSSADLEALDGVKEPFIDQNFELEEEAAPPGGELPSDSLVEEKPAEPGLAETSVFELPPVDDPLADLEEKEARLTEDPAPEFGIVSDASDLDEGFGESLDEAEVALDFGGSVGGSELVADDMAESVVFIPSEVDPVAGPPRRSGCRASDCADRRAQEEAILVVALWQEVGRRDSEAAQAGKAEEGKEVEADRSDCPCGRRADRGW